MHIDTRIVVVICGWNCVTDERDREKGWFSDIERAKAFPDTYCAHFSNFGRTCGARCNS